MRHLFILGLLMGLCGFSGKNNAYGNSDVEPRSIVVSGNIQFWSRVPCGQNQQCEIPTSDSGLYSFTGKLTEPTSPGKMTRIERSFSFENKRAQLFVSWVSRNTTQDPQYLSTQWKVFSADGRLITECSRYDKIPSDEKYNPVGACSGLFEERQIGITTSKF